MDRRNRSRLELTAFCRIASVTNRRRSAWKRIENISGAGMLLAWSRGEEEIRLPKVGEQYTVDLPLPPHPVFGERALQFKTKVVRVFKQAHGPVMAGLQSTQGRFKFVRAAPWQESNGPTLVN